MNQVKNYFHRGENVSTAVEMFTPRWKCFHRGGNYFHLSIAFIVSPGCLDLVMPPSSSSPSSSSPSSPSSPSSSLLIYYVIFNTSSSSSSSLSSSLLIYYVVSDSEHVQQRASHSRHPRRVREIQGNHRIRDVERRRIR